MRALMITEKQSLTEFSIETVDTLSRSEQVYKVGEISQSLA